MADRLSRRDVIHAALALLDRGGADAITLRGIARHLDVHLNSVSLQVGSKARLFDLMADAILGELSFDDLPHPPIDRVKEIFRRYRQVLLNHRDGAHLVSGTRVSETNTLRLGEAVIAALLDAGVKVTLASIKTDPIQGMQHDVKGDTIVPDMLLEDVDTEDYTALLLPGGVANPDTLRLNDRAIEIIEEFADDEKLIAAICHAPWLLIEADVVDGVRMTSWPSVRTDLANAGADVVDEAVVRDGPFITSRNPDDIPAFNAAILEALQEELEEA